MAPDRKVTAGALAGALTVILAWMLREFAGIEMPAEVSSAVTVLVSFVVAYFVPNPTSAA